MSYNWKILTVEFAFDISTKLNKRSTFAVQTTSKILNDALVLCIFNLKVTAMADFHDSNGPNLKIGQT